MIWNILTKISTALNCKASGVNHLVSISCIVKIFKWFSLSVRIRCALQCKTVFGITLPTERNIYYTAHYLCLYRTFRFRFPIIMFCTSLISHQYPWRSVEWNQKRQNIKSGQEPESPKQPGGYRQSFKTIQRY